MSILDVRGDAFDTVAEVAWGQFLNMHHRLHDLQTEGGDEDEPFPTSVSQASLTFAECEYRGGLSALCHLGYVLGMGTTLPHPDDGQRDLFSLKRSEEVLLDWAARQGKTFPDNLRVPNFRN